MQHITFIEGPDTVGHYGWRCEGCGEDASGYEPGEVVEAAMEHGPLAANSPRPEEDPEDEW